MYVRMYSVYDTPSRYTKCSGDSFVIVGTIILHTQDSREVIYLFAENPRFGINSFHMGGACLRALLHILASQQNPPPPVSFPVDPNGRDFKSNNGRII